MRLRMFASALPALILVVALSLLPIPAIAGGLLSSRHQVFPNPFTTKCTFELNMPYPGHVRVIVYDVLGRQVRVLRDEETGAGLFFVEWDGTDESGTEMQAGIYIAVLWQNGKAVSSAKVVKRSAELR